MFPDVEGLLELYEDHHHPNEAMRQQLKFARNITLCFEGVVIACVLGAAISSYIFS